MKKSVMKAWWDAGGPKRARPAKVKPKMSASEKRALAADFDVKVKRESGTMPKTVYGTWSTGVDGTKFFAAEPDPEAMVMVGEKKLVGEYRLFRMVEVERATIVRINNSPGRK